MSLELRRRLIGGGITYKGVPMTLRNIGAENAIISLSTTTNPLLYVKCENDSFYRKWDYSSISLYPSQTVCFFGENSTIDSTFIVEGNTLLHLDGKLESLCHNKTIGAGAFRSLFKNVTQLFSVGDVMPNTDIIEKSSPNLQNIYDSLFYGTSIECIPSDFIKETRSFSWAQGEMYKSMFAFCKNLKTIPKDLFAKQTKSGYGSYTSMFEGCENLQVAADVYFKTQGFNTTNAMYKGCKNIEDVTIYTENMSSNHCMMNFAYGATKLKRIEIRASANANWGIYFNAMSGCTSLEEVIVHFTSWLPKSNPTYGICQDWMSDVPSIGVFRCPQELADATDGYYDEEGNFVAGVGRSADTIPVGWEIQIID